MPSFIINERYTIEDIARGCDAILYQDGSALMFSDSISIMCADKAIAFERIRMTRDLKCIGIRPMQSIH